MAGGISRRLAAPALALASLALVAGVGEVVLRMRHAELRRNILRSDTHLTRNLCTEPDPDPALVYRHTPGYCGNNSRGFHDDEHTFAKPDGVRRVVVIGDSVAVGHGVLRSERFVRVVADRLAESGVRIEVVNLARTGYSTSQELLLLEREGYAYEPDVVVWSYVLNDPAHPIFHNANGDLGVYFARPTSYLWHDLKRRIFLLRERRAERGCPDEYHERLHCIYADDVDAAIARIGALAAEHATPTIFVIHPIFVEDADTAGAGFDDLHAKLAARARAAGLEVVDLLDVYARHDSASLQQDPGWFDPWHPNELGHALAADALEAPLRSALGVD